jgi:hypothetical protein
MYSLKDEMTYSKITETLNLGWKIKLKDLNLHPGE